MLLSVVIPTHNRTDLLEVCLEHLMAERRLDDADKWEVIVSDDGDTEDSKKLIEQKFSSVKWTRCNKRGPGPNRNNGSRIAGGDWLVFIDDDCLAQPEFISNLLLLAKRSDIDVIEGKIVCPDKRDSPLLIQPENLSGGLFWTGNLAIRRRIFEDIGGFDEDLTLRGEDMDIARRIKERKLNTIFAPDVIVHHRAQKMTLHLFWQRMFTDRRWLVIYHQKDNKLNLQGGSILKRWLLITVSEATNLVREAVQYITSFNRNWWRSGLVNLIWRWLTFPAVLPYILMWDFRFHRINAAKKEAQ